jgi:hypothetical protein
MEPRFRDFDRVAALDTANDGKDFGDRKRG